MQKVPLIQLKNVGKIYVSEGNVAVGIRGVDLAFESGEFVAVTGTSGSGKSTLLNVISGMDTYEEGEMLVEGEPTSHYTQKDWEVFRENYISFIFQDYNIIESFTVLQNVELALMHMEDPHARREKAMELLRRVGMEGHIQHKGSKLSGGQKQRTVIARALAKDSPIILADEPTGNLDSKSSAEIIELLREISEEKLVIIVTHNFDEVEHCATRHIRIFDGAVELDHACRPAATDQAAEAVVPADAELPAPRRLPRHTMRDGMRLGLIRFASKPKLTVFLCCLMTVASLVITFITATSSGVGAFFDKPSMFTYSEGRTVIVREDGAVITEEELQNLAAAVGASDAVHYDFMLDRTALVWLENAKTSTLYDCSFGYPATGVELDAGRYPKTAEEVILELPISAKRYLEKDGFRETELPDLFGMTDYRVVGVRYYYDNTRNPRMLFTESGYKTASALAYFSEQGSGFTCRITVEMPEQSLIETDTLPDILVDFDLPAGSFYVNYPPLHMQTDENGNAMDAKDINLSAAIVGAFTDYRDYSYDPGWGYDDSNDVWVEDKPIMDGTDKPAVEYTLMGKAALTSAEIPASSRRRLENRYGGAWAETVGLSHVGFVVVSPDVLMDFMYEHYYAKAYTQASLFFASDRAAHAEVEALRDRGYIAVVSDETVEPDLFELIVTRIALIFELGSWILTVFLATMLLYLCTSRAMNAVRGDIAIMRSMGIPTKVIRVSIYVQTFLSLIPALLITAIACTVIYMLPSTNSMFTFLHAPDYIILAVALMATAFFLSRKQAGRMFRDSVKKTLRGGKKS